MTGKEAAATGSEAGRAGFAYTVINKKQQLDTELVMFQR